MPVCVPISSYEDTSHMGLGLTPRTLFYLNYLFKDPISKYGDILRSWELGLRYRNVGGYSPPSQGLREWPD